VAVVAAAIEGGEADSVVGVLVPVSSGSDGVEGAVVSAEGLSVAGRVVTGVAERGAELVDGVVVSAAELSGAAEVSWPTGVPPPRAAPVTAGRFPDPPPEVLPVA
jgi:hypothetical protein